MHVIHNPVLNCLTELKSLTEEGSSKEGALGMKDLRKVYRRVGVRDIQI